METTKGNWTRRRALATTMAAAAALATTTSATVAQAQDNNWPQKPLRFIVPYAAGSGVDVSMRPVADAMARELGQAVAVDNRPSAGGIVGTQLIATAPPDGYTFGYGNITTLAINTSFFTKLPYNTEKDLAPIGLFMANAYVVVARNSLPADNFQELLAYGRKSGNNKLSVGNPAIGGAGHLTGELLRAQTGLPMEAVPYKTGTQAVGDMVNGQLDLTIENVSAVLPFIQSGQIKALAVTSAKRVSVLPQVPTLAESGVPGFDVVAWGGLVAPAGTPKKAIDRLNAAMRKAMADPAVVRAHAALSVEPMLSSPEEFTALVKQETPRWAEVVKRAGVKAD
jgi:tripartite-type tricarboxylate transporter receptor subunit TctC